ncbi:MAG: TetR/AcrR family transcriptional regulator [Anaerolineae bacterium]
MRNIQRSEETRNSILEAAAKRFAKQGYDATGVAEICRRAGVSKGAFYYHFDSKQAVFIELVERWRQELEEAINELDLKDVRPDTPVTADNSVPARLVKMTHLFEQILASQSTQLALLLEFWIQASREPTVREIVLSPYRRFQQFFTALIQEGIAEGTLHPIDPEAGAQTLLSLASGLFFQALLENQPASGSRKGDWSATAEKSTQILLEGMRR